jgi:hypothetical protein
MMSGRASEPVAPEPLPANWWAEEDNEDSEVAALDSSAEDKHLPESGLASFVRTAALWTVVIIVYLLAQYIIA